jgi:hypothetical protein
VEIYADLRERVIDVLIQVLLSDSNSYSSQYGAIEGIIAFGNEAYVKILLPILENYRTELKST